MKKTIVLMFDTDGMVSSQITRLLASKPQGSIQPIEIEGDDPSTIDEVKKYLDGIEIDVVYAYTKDIHGIVYMGLKSLIDVTVSEF